MGSIIFIIIFLIVFFILLKFGLSFSSESKMNKRRVAGLADTEEAFAELHHDFGQAKSGIASVMEGLVSGFRKTDSGDSELTLKLYRAGITSPNAPAYYLFFTSFGWMIGLGILFIFYTLSQQQPQFKLPLWAIGLLFAAIATFGAPLYMKNAMDKRQKILLRSFPDTLDLLLVCVESGLALDAALARVCKELKFAHPEMTDELNRTRIELTMLNDREKALSNFSKRTDLVAVKSLVAALLQSEKFGTSLVETLRVLSDDYRQTRMMIAEEKAGKLPTKITVATIPFMIMALLILITTPAIIRAGTVMEQNRINK